MVTIGNWSFLFILLTSVLLRADGPPKIEAALNRAEINLGEAAVLTIRVTTTGGEQVGKPVLSHVEGFDVQPPNVSVAARAEFGPQGLVSSRTTSYTFLLVPQKVGDFRVGASEIQVGGQSFRTNAQSLKVVKSGARRGLPPPSSPTFPGQEDENVEPEDPFDVMEDQFLQQLQRRGLMPPAVRPQIGNPQEAFSVQLAVDKTQVYVGEQATASYWLYTRSDIRGIDTLKYPTLKDFWKEDIEVATNLNWQSEVINGVPYRKALLASYALFPMKEGTALVDAYKAKCTVLMGGGGFGFGQPYNFTKSSSEVKIKVLPVPADGRPKEYNGGVGEFEMKAAIGQKQVSAHAPFSLKIRFEGRGNAKAIEMPALNLPPNLEIYSQRDESKFFPNGTSYKEFEVLLIAREQGKLVIPALDTAFFSPAKRAYYAAHSDPIEINVGAGSRPSGGGGGVVDAPTSKILGPSIVMEWREPRWTLQQEIGFWGVLYLLLLGTLSWKAYRELIIGNRKTSLIKVLDLQLKKVEDLARKGDFRGFGTSAMNVISMILGELAGESGADQEIDKYLFKLAPSVRAEIDNDLRQVVSALEVLAFAPETAIQNRKDPAQMKALSAQLRRVLLKAVELAQETGKRHVESRAEVST